MKMIYAPLHADVHSCEKALQLAIDYPILYDNIFTSLTRIWLRCRVKYTDGILRMDGQRIELMANWTEVRGFKKGEFIEIVTRPATQYIDKISDNEYRVHDFYKNIPFLDPDKQKKELEYKQAGGYKKGFLDQLKVINDNGVELDACPWLYQHETGQMRVEYRGNALPEKMDLGEGKIFTSRNEFYHANRDTKNKDRDNEIKKNHNKLIKRYTKRCGKCKSICVSSTPTCFGCVGM